MTDLPRYCSHEAYIPTPEEIAAATAKIRETWDDEEYHRRSKNPHEPLALEPIDATLLFGDG